VLLNTGRRNNNFCQVKQIYCNFEAKFLHMKKLIALFSLFTLVTFVGCSQTQSNEKAIKVEITFDKTLHDFGTIPYEGDGSCTFTFKNTGKEPLVLSNVSSSCGCTVPEWPKDPVEPGATGVIKVKYNTRIPGNFGKSITVFSNAANSPIALQIKGVVENPKPAAPAK
jgi:archaellum component FlaG (FlaF/FlaG flagellin family)